jgi:hypothetical protein
MNDNLNNINNDGKLINVWGKLLIYIFIPFFAVFIDFKKFYTKKTAGFMALIAMIIFIAFWANIFNGDNKETQLKENLNDYVKECSILTEKNKTISAQLAQTKKELQKIKAYSKLTDKEKAAQKAKKEKIKQDAKKKQLKESYQKWIDKQFSAWNGDCFLLKDQVKNVLDDPSSYKLIDLKYWEQPDYKSIVVKSWFTCKNAFNGTVKNYARCKLIRLDDEKSKLIEFSLNE